MRASSELRDRLRFAVLTGASGARYQMRELIGEGGQGWVFKAAQEDAGAPFVVVKVLRPDVAKSDILSRFEREATVLRALSSGPTPHPNIVRFFEHGRGSVRTDTGPVEISYLVLEHVDGPPLRKVLAAHGGFGLPVARVRRILRQVARALTDMHAQGIIHRDLKPSNVLLAHRPDDRAGGAPGASAEIAKVTDFGLVKLLDASVQQTITIAGASAGYAPPEQYEAGNRRVGPATDVFAFAAILYESLSGCEAFPVGPNDTALRIVARMLGDDRPALARVSATIPRELRDRPEITAALDREIARATDGDPDRRHASIDELWGAVEPLLRSGSSPSIGKLSDPPPASNPTSSDGPRDRSDAGRTHASREPLAPTARTLGKPMTGERLRGAAFAEDGASIVAIGAYGMYRFAGGVWSALRSPRGVDAKSLRGVLRCPSGELLLYGDGCVMLATKDGASARLDASDSDVVWLGAMADDLGMVLLGERRSHTVGVVAILPVAGKTIERDVEGTTRLHAAARLDGGQILVCGTHGALSVIDGDEVHDVEWGRTGHLYAATSAPDGGAFAVGSGGHALTIAPPHPSLRGVAPPATLEAVQTTRDLCGVTVDAAGTAWAIGAQGRLLVRQAGTWIRVGVDAGSAGLIAVFARDIADKPGTARPPREIVTVAEDGTVVETRPDG